MSFPFNTVTPMNYGSIDLDNQDLFSVNIHSLDDYGFSTVTQEDKQAIFDMATLVATRRYQDAAYVWDAASFGTLGLNVPGWYIDTSVENVGDITQWWGTKQYTFGPMYNNGTLVDPDTSVQQLAAGGAIIFECRAMAVKVANSGEKGGHLYDVFFAYKENLGSGDEYRVLGGFSVFPACQMDDLDFEEDVPPGPDPDDPNEDDPESTTGEDGGDGSHTPDYDPIPIPPKPTLGASKAGFVTMYTMDYVFMNLFASDFFASDVWEAIRLFFGNPIDTLVGVLLVPFAPDEGTMYYMKWGTVKSHSRYISVANQYFDVDCGEIAVSKYWGSAFDFEPFTKIQIWLPYIGYRDLPVDEIMDHTIHVMYRCDCLTGDCVAFVSTGVVGQTGPQIPRVIAQFYGNCGVRVPFGSVSFDSAIAASINLMVGVAGLAEPGSMNVTEDAKGKQVIEEVSHSVQLGDFSRLTGPTMNVVSAMKPNVQKGGAAGASTGYMSIQKPYLIRRIPRQNLPDGYKDFHGYPANIRSTLGELGGGYAEVDDIQLNNIPAFEDERKEIIAWLKGGVLL